jgi:hypothetical protein
LIETEDKNWNYENNKPVIMPFVELNPNEKDKKGLMFLV